MTERALAERMSADLSGLDRVAVMIDGVNFAAHTCVVALGIRVDGTKVPLGLMEGSTENATVVTGLLTSLRDRGLDVTRPTLVVIDGATALAKAARNVFNRPVIQRCQLHKIRDVEHRLSKTLAATVAKKMRAAYRDPDPLHAEAALEALARSLERAHPGAGDRWARDSPRRSPSTGLIVAPIPLLGRWSSFAPDGRDRGVSRRPRCVGPALASRRSSGGDESRAPLPRPRGRGPSAARGGRPVLPISWDAASSRVSSSH